MELCGHPGEGGDLLQTNFLQGGAWDWEGSQFARDWPKSGVAGGGQKKCGFSQMDAVKNRGCAIARGLERNCVREKIQTSRGKRGCTKGKHCLGSCGVRKD